jgi:peptidoglycan/LPS O-acetylase OafA/YrhL
MKRVVALDLLRGIAAFLVAIPHFLLLNGMQSGLVETVSVLAVEVFFALSGFVLAPQILFCAQRQRLGDLRVFLVRRWMRTIPPFLFALIVMAILANQLYTADFLRYCFYVQNLFTQQNSSDFFPVAWSLSIEEWFYVVFPLFLFVICRFAGASATRSAALTTIGFIALVTVLRTIAGDQAHWGADVRRVVVFRVDSIAYGFLFYLLIGGRNLNGHVEIRRPSQVVPALLAFVVAAGVAFAVASDIAVHDGRIAQSLFPFVAAGLGITAINFFLSIGEILGRFPTAVAFSNFMGKISYSVYLFHLALAQFLYEESQSYPMILQVGIFVLILSIFAHLVYIYFERPILAARPGYENRLAPSLGPMSEEEIRRA